MAASRTPILPVLMKAKSDYVTEPMTEQGILTLLNGLVKAPGEIAVLCDTYGGAINKVCRRRDGRLAIADGFLQLN